MDAIDAHLARGPAAEPLPDGLVFDAVRVRLTENGEAVKDLDPAVLEREPGLPWRSIAGIRDRLVHRCFDTDHSIVTATCQRASRSFARRSSGPCWFSSKAAETAVT